MSKVVRLFSDGLRNLVSGLGTGRDKSFSSEYTDRTLTASQLLTAYRNAWLPRKIVDIPALDSTRRWRRWVAEDTEITDIVDLERRLWVKQKVLRARTMSRLFGGAALLIGVREDPLDRPLDPTSVRRGDLRYVTVLGSRMLTAEQWDWEPESPWFGQPLYWRLVRRGGTSSTEALTKIHASRIVPFRPAEIPADEMVEGFQGWGDSVLQSSYEALLQCDATTANIASLVFEAKIDIVKLPDFMMNLSDPTYEKLVMDRFSLAATAKGINGVLILDKEEEWQQKSPQFAQLAILMDRFFQNMSGAADIPMTRLFGMSPAGMNASGESDLRNYYDRVQSVQDLEIGPALQILDEVLVRSALGEMPQDVTYNWRSLWQTTEKEQAETGRTLAEMAKTISESGTIAPEAVGTSLVQSLEESGALPDIARSVREVGGVDGDDEDV